MYHCTIIYLTSSWSLDIEVAASSFNLQRMVPQYGHSCSHLYSYLLRGFLESDVPGRRGTILYIFKQWLANLFYKGPDSK